MNLYKQSQRLDYILIWGHGLQYKWQIINMIEDDNNFRITKLISHTPKNIKHLVKHIYSYDYAPFHHLKNKVKYLMKTPNEVFFIFFENLNSSEDFFGENEYRHLESQTLKILKENIRNQFNPKKDGKRTEDHVIHASDNEAQTDYTLKYLGYSLGIESTTPYLRPIKTPHHIQQSQDHTITIKETPISELKASILDQTSTGKIGIVAKNIEETPHFQAIQGNWGAYDQYLKRYLGYQLTDYYSVRKLKALKESYLQYLEHPHELDYILTRKNKDHLRILDGVHRACLLKDQGITSIPIAIIQ